MRERKRGRKERHRSKDRIDRWCESSVREMERQRERERNYEERIEVGEIFRDKQREERARERGI